MDRHTLTDLQSEEEHSWMDTGVPLFRQRVKEQRRQSVEVELPSLKPLRWRSFNCCGFLEANRNDDELISREAGHNDG